MPTATNAPDYKLVTLHALELAAAAYTLVQRAQRHEAPTLAPPPALETALDGIEYAGDGVFCEQCDGSGRDSHAEYLRRGHFVASPCPECTIERDYDEDPYVCVGQRCQGIGREACADSGKLDDGAWHVRGSLCCRVCALTAAGFQADGSERDALIDGALDALESAS